MSALSDQVVSIATMVYLLAMISHAVEYALGASRARVVAAPAPELVGAAVGRLGGRRFGGHRRWRGGRRWCGGRWFGGRGRRPGGGR